ncbi:MAG: hypothetical protein OWT28_12220 [Firmicutes bacterium]|nr:hypothetical protein [Bacillota bacterium]
MKKASPPKRAIRITPTTRALIRRESKALSLSEREYVQLISQLAEAIRGSVLPEGTKDASTLRALIENPLLLSVAAAMAGTVWNSVKDQLSGSDDSAEAEVSDSKTTAPAPAPTQPSHPGGVPRGHVAPTHPYGYPYQPIPGRPYPAPIPHPFANAPRQEITPPTHSEPLAQAPSRPGPYPRQTTLRQTFRP